MNPIFSRNPDYEKIAFMNWRMGEDNPILNMANIAEGFLRSSIELAQHCIENNTDKRADIFIFPIFTNANHGIELYLKSILYCLNVLLKNDNKLQRGHNIKQLYETVVARIKDYGSSALTSMDFDDATQNLKSYIDELVQTIEATPKNDKMDFSRYPIDNKSGNHFYVEQIGNVTVDLENFADRFSQIFDNLKLIAWVLYHQMEDNWDV